MIKLTLQNSRNVVILKFAVDDMSTCYNVLHNTNKEILVVIAIL